MILISQQKRNKYLTYDEYCFFLLFHEDAKLILEALSEMHLFSKLFLKADMQEALSDYEKDESFPFQKCSRCMYQVWVGHTGALIRTFFTVFFLIFCRHLLIREKRGKSIVKYLVKPCNTTYINKYCPRIRFPRETLYLTII